LLRQIQDLTQEGGINLAGVKMIIELQAQLDALRAETDELQDRLREREHDAGSDGKIVPLTSVFLPPWQGRPRP
jgi:DNA-binding transcriptional MerR regulator